jgi:hypothetical protein
MSKPSREMRERQPKTAQKHRVPQDDSKALTEHFQGEREDIFPVAETPFQPRMDEHAELLSATHADEARSNLIIHLQRTYGNGYVQRLVESIKIQAKLDVSQPGDVQEQEADRVAEAVSLTIETQVQRQSDEEEEEIQAKRVFQSQTEKEEVHEAPMAGSITVIGQQQGVQTFVQRGIFDKIRGWFSGLFGPKKPPEPELSDEEAMRMLGELNQQIEEEEGGKEELPEEKLSEEDERMLAELEKEGEEKPEEVSDEESEKALAELGAEMEKEPEEEMTPQELDAEIDRIEGMTDVLHNRHDKLYEQQVTLTGKYAKLVVKDGKEKQADDVYNKLQEVIEERERVAEELQNAHQRLTELLSRKQDKISEIMAKPLGPESSEEENEEIESELEQMEEHSVEQEKRKSDIEDSLKPEKVPSAPGILELVPGISEIKPESPKEDNLDWLMKREMTPEEEAEMEDELGRVTEELADEERTEQLKQALTALPDYSKTKLGAIEEGIKEEEEEGEKPKKREVVLLKESGHSLPEVSDKLEAKINTNRDSGNTLSKEIRLPMEETFGADFSGVRVHTDSEANDLNESLQARAFTTGNDIFFRQGEYNEDSGEGRKLLAHELTHAIQQGASQRKETNENTQ